MVEIYDGDLPTRAGSPALRFLTVCTGNICRSPLAQLLLRQDLSNLPVTVSSAGTHALVGEQLPSMQQDIARALGIPTPETHRGEQLELSHVNRVDLVLAMERDHRSALVRLSPKILRQTFTLREFARITRFIPDEELMIEDAADVQQRLRHAIETVAINRGLVPPPEDPADYDVVDPYRRSPEIYNASRDQILEAVNAIAAYFRRAVK